MTRTRFPALVLGLISLLSLLAWAGSSWAGGPGVWTKLATVDNGADTVGMARTPDGNLHLVWLNQETNNKPYGYGTGTISSAGKLLATGTALSGWRSLQPDPRLVSNGSGLRLIFNGNTGSSASCYSKGEIFTETSANGSSWTLFQGSMDQDTTGAGGIAATTESNGTPVVAFSQGHLFHVGVDSSCPAAKPDGTITMTGNPSNPAIVTDPHNGSVWVAWFQSNPGGGYFVDQILPTQGTPQKAAQSAPTNSQNNQPLEPVALAGRVGGGEYMAYCVADNSQPCVHIDLWKVGSPKPIVVPGSEATNNARVALANGPKGVLAVAWYNAANGGAIHAVVTNTAATAFGTVHTIKPPAHTTGFTDIQAQDSTGDLDIVINAQVQVGSSYPYDLFHTQILP